MESDFQDKEEQDQDGCPPADRGLIVIMASIALHAFMYVHGTWLSFCGFYLFNMLFTLAPMLIGVVVYFLLKSSLGNLKWDLVVVISGVNLAFGLLNYLVIC